MEKNIKRTEFERYFSATERLMIQNKVLSLPKLYD
jgi:hypothetical protein